MTEAKPLELLIPDRSNRLLNDARTYCRCRACSSDDLSTGKAGVRPPRNRKPTTESFGNFFFVTVQLQEKINCSMNLAKRTDNAVVSD